MEEAAPQVNVHERGLVNPITVLDAAIGRRVVSEHQEDVCKAVLHEFNPNGLTHAIVRRDALVAAGAPPDPNFTVELSYDLRRPEDGKGYKRPTLVVTSNSCLTYDKAVDLFNITGGTDNTKDSTYGQGINVGSLTMSMDVHVEAYALDLKTGEGSVSLYRVMAPSHLLPAALSTTEHASLTIPFFVDAEDDDDDEDSDDEEEDDEGPAHPVVWLQSSGEDDASEVAQQNLALFIQQSIHAVRKKNKKSKAWTHNPVKSRERIESTILNEVIPLAEATSNRACVVMFLTGDSWGANPPFKKVQIEGEGPAKFDLACRKPGPREGEPSWTLLGEACLKEWANSSISTVALPNGVTQCFRRTIFVCGFEMNQLGERDKYTDWSTSILEDNLGKPEDDPEATVEYTYESPNGGSVLLRVTLHPDVMSRDYSPGASGWTAQNYETRNSVTDEELGFARASGGNMYYLTRHQGSSNQLFNGELTMQESSSCVLGMPTPRELSSQIGGGNNGAYQRGQVVRLATMCGCNPDSSGNFCDEDLDLLDDLVGMRGRGVDALWSLTQNDPNYEKNATKGGLKPPRVTDILTKLIGYDVLFDIQHDLTMLPNKTKIAIPDDGHALITWVRRCIFKHVVTRDPRLVPLLDKVHSDWQLEEYDNQKNSPGVVLSSRPVGPALSAAERRIHALRPDAVRRAHRLRDAETTAERAAEAPEAIYEHMRNMALHVLDLKTLDELERGPGGGRDWPVDSWEYKWRALLRHKNGTAHLPQLGKKVKSLRIRWPLLAMLQLQDAIKNAARPADNGVYVARLERLNDISRTWHRSLLKNQGDCAHKRRYKKRDAAAADGAERMDTDSEDDGPDPNAEEFADEGGPDDDGSDDDNGSDDDSDSDDPPPPRKQPAPRPKPRAGQPPKPPAPRPKPRVNSGAGSSGAAGSSTTNSGFVKRKAAAPPPTYNDNAIEARFARAAGDTGPDRHSGGDTSMIRQRVA